MLLVAFKNPKLKPLTGKTLAEVAKMRGKSPEETAMDLVIEDGSRVGTVYFLMSEDNVKREVGAAVDELRLRRGVAGARGRVPQVAVAIRAPTAISPGCSANMSATSSGDAAGRGPAAELAAGDQPRHRSAAR